MKQIFEVPSSLPILLLGFSIAPHLRLNPNNLTFRYFVGVNILKQILSFSNPPKKKKKSSLLFSVHLFDLQNTILRLQHLRDRPQFPNLKYSFTPAVRSQTIVEKGSFFFSLLTDCSYGNMFPSLFCHYNLYSSKMLSKMKYRFLSVILIFSIFIPFKNPEPKPIRANNSTFFLCWDIGF